VTEGKRGRRELFRQSELIPSLLSARGRGIGRAAVDLLASPGRCGGLPRQRGASAQAAAEAIKSRGAARSQAGSTSPKITLLAGTRAMAKSLGRIDALVNCAGITGNTNIKAHDVDPADFDRVLGINLRGAFMLSKHVLPHMVAQKYGRLLHIASIAGKEGNAGMTAYSASKAGLIGLVKSMAKDYVDRGITINTLAPAVIRTPMVDAMPQASQDYMTAKIPMGRCGELEEAAQMIAWIVSPACSFTTGFTFDLVAGAPPLTGTWP
jgi:3-oxoacyl-[acyl-carrier protein] reductase